MGETRTRTELLADEIAQKIRQKIQKQEYAQGERLTVRWLCEEFGASETPVKQALNQLVSTGLPVILHILKGKGTHTHTAFRNGNYKPR